MKKILNTKLLITLLAIIIIYFTGSDTARGNTKEHDSFNSKDICVAGLATLIGWSEDRNNGLPFGRVIETERDIHTIKSSIGTYKCYVEGNKVIWSSNNGRWRNLPEDGTITYLINGKNNTITTTFNIPDVVNNSDEYSKNLLNKYTQVKNNKKE